MTALPIQKRIRQRRLDFGASVEDMARLGGLSADRWRQIESGEPLKTAELGGIARSLAVDAGTLLRGDESSPRRSVARFRQAVDPMLSGQHLEASRTLALAAELGRLGGELSRRLGRPSPIAAQRRPVPVQAGEEPWKQGHRLADTARRVLGLPPGPVRDLQAAFEDWGVHVARLSFAEPSIDAASLVESGALPVILLNEASPRVQNTLPRRATLSHELCHLLYDSGEHDLATRLSGDLAPSDQDPIEQRARAFAPAFLAPPDEVRQWFRTGRGRHLREPQRKVRSLASRWGLSWSAAVWHAKNCRVIQSATAVRLDRESMPTTWQVDFESTPATASFDTSLAATPSALSRGHLAGVVHQAMQSGIVSEGRAREILTWA